MPNILEGYHLPHLLSCLPWRSTIHSTSSPNLAHDTMRSQPVPATSPPPRYTTLDCKPPQRASHRAAELGGSLQFGAPSQNCTTFGPVFSRGSTVRRGNQPYLPPTIRLSCQIHRPTVLPLPYGPSRAGGHGGGQGGPRGQTGLP